MSAEEIKKNVLSAISKLSDDDIYRHIDRKEILQETNIIEKDLLIYLEKLKEMGYIRIHKYVGSHFAVSITSNGVLYLRDLKFESPQNQAYQININDVHGSIVNIASSLQGTVQNINLPSGIDKNEENEFKTLIDQLSQTLAAADPQKVTPDDVEAVADSAKDLTEAISKKEKPNKLRVQITREGLQKAASNIANTLPEVMPIVTQIVTCVQRMFP
ncbi:MAG TPA: hypothetical protein VFS21_31020 [Roseiflexaceae bacterium]|nr:hypothetical protein [Roseiflexaceae bacterium]